MSVLQCDRKGCENIMCDRYHPKYGYLCDECFEEIVNKGVTTDIENFMETGKKPEINRNASFKYFDTIFENRLKEGE